MSENISLDDLNKLAILRREKPDEYKQFLKDVEEVMVDLFDVSERVEKRIQER